MVDWRKPAKEVRVAFAKENIAIGPTRSRITVGSAAAVVRLNL